jgi:predicted aspartyl protease
MRGRVFRVLLLWTVWITAGQPAAWGYHATASGRVAKTAVSFELYQDYLIVVRGAAGPLKGLNFLLDTGASPSVLDRGMAARLHLEVAEERIAVVGGNVQGGRATVPDLEVGPIRRENLPVLVQDLSYVQGVFPFRVDGIVGLDVLGRGEFVIDYVAREIRFGATPAMRDSIPLQMEEGLAFVDATVNHAQVHLLLDTGAPSLVLFEQVAASGAKAAEPQSSSKSVGKPAHTPIQLSSFSLGAAEFGREHAFVVRNQRDAGHDFDGLMNPLALGISQVAVDVERGTMAFARE